MTRKITFDGSADHRIYFRLLYDAFASRGTASRDKRFSSDDHRSDARILRAFKQLGEPIGEPPLEGELDARPRRLAAAGTLELTQSDFKRLQGYCESTQWIAVMTDVAMDMEDWLDTAEKVTA